MGDIIIANVKEIRDVAVYGTLPAYGDLEFMMPTSEINVRRGKRVADYVRVGENIVTQVISVTGGKIDTSMKLVREEEKTDAMERYHKSCRVFNIVRCALGLVATEEDIKQVYEAHLWPLVDDELFSLFESIRAGAQPPDEFPAAVVAEIMARMPAPVFTASAERMIRFGHLHDGIARLNAELKRLAGSEGIQVHVVAPPKYRIMATAGTQEEANNRLAAALTPIPAPC
jgi:translation initiation factor 2 alpha subunit (eIF-2alpha)